MASFWDSIVSSVGSIDPKTLNAYGTSLDAFGKVFTASSDLAFASQVMGSANATADQLKAAGNDEAGAAQRSAINEEERAKIVASSALAQAAASGGGASDPTVVNMIAKIASEGAYRKSVALYQGEAAKENADYRARVAQYEGKVARNKAIVGAIGSIFSAGTTLMTGAARGAGLEAGGTMFDRFGGGGPGTPSWGRG